MIFDRLFDKLRQPRRLADEPRLSILAVCLFLEDRFLLERLASRHGWNLHFAPSPGEGFRMASRYAFDLILCDRYQPGHPWREVLDRLSAGSPHSCLLLVSPSADDYLWGEAAQHGAHDIMIRPLREAAALRAIETARLRLWFDAAPAAARK